MAASAEVAILSNESCLMTCRYPLDGVLITAPEAWIRSSSATLVGPRVAPTPNTTGSPWHSEPISRARSPAIPAITWGSWIIEAT
jgi:hypothetical protein